LTLFPYTTLFRSYTTGDFGRLEKGFLYYVGRADDLINCAGVKVSPELLQEKINRRLNLENKIAVCRIKDELRGEGFFVAVEKNSGINMNDVLETAHAELLALGVNARSSIKVQEIRNIPRTETGKVQRKELAKSYTEIPAEKTSHTLPGEKHSVLDIFSSIFPGVAIKPADTFKSLGGDSLSYIQMLMLLETRLGYAPGDWDKMSVERLEQIERKKVSSLFGWLDTTVFLRVIAIMAVVAIHSGGGSEFSGGTLLLFALIGYNMARFKSAEFFEGKIWPWMKTYSVIILIPYFIAVALYLGWNRSFEIDELLLYANLDEAKITTLFPFWFVQVLLQCLLLSGIIFSVPAWRSYAKKAPAMFSFAVLACMIAIRAAYPFFWDAEHLHHLVPLRFMAILWLGWCFYFAETLPQRMLLCTVGIAFAFLDTGLLWGFDFIFSDTILSGPTKWLLLGSIFLTFVSRVPIPAFMRNIFNDIGAATFYIFVLNGIFIKLVEYVFNPESAFIVFCLTMAGSMSVWWAMEHFRLIERLQTILNVKAVS
jgi:acyl carrier protein